jgi:hypothetical protein
VSGLVRVVAEDLKLSASQVDGHADGLRLAHGAADGQIEGAHSGLPAGSAAALGGALAKWKSETAVHYTRMADHSTGLRSGAAAYGDTDAQSAADLAAVEDAVPSLDLGL